MIIIAIVIGCIIGALIGMNVPMISYTYSTFLAIAVVAALTIFISGFFCNSILSIALTYLGQKLNLDIYLAALVVFVGRMFTNLTIIRRYYIEKWTEMKQKRTKKVAK